MEVCSSGVFSPVGQPLLNLDGNKATEVCGSGVFSPVGQLLLNQDSNDAAEGVVAVCQLGG